MPPVEQVKEADFKGASASAHWPFHFCRSVVFCRCKKMRFSPPLVVKSLAPSSSKPPSTRRDGHNPTQTDGVVSSVASLETCLTAVGFEPTQLALVELESTPLDHSGKLSCRCGQKRTV